MAHAAVRLSSGETRPSLGLGTWHMGGRAASRNGEIAALGAGIDLYLLHWRGGTPLAETARAFAPPRRKMPLAMT